jgi:hypothetical protein
LWSDSAAITGEIKSIEPVKPEGEENARKGMPGLLILIELAVAADSNLGQHSTPWTARHLQSSPFFVYQEPVVAEGDLTLDGSAVARRISRLPAVVRTSGDFRGVQEKPRPLSNEMKTC